MSLKDTRTQDESPLWQKARRLQEQLPYLPRALRLIWQVAPGLALGRAAVLLLGGVLPAVSIALTRLLVDRLTHILEAAPIPAALLWQELNGAVLLALGIGVALLLGQLLQSLGSWIHTAQAEQIGMHVSGLIQEKASLADYSLFETPEKIDKLYRARSEAAFRPVAVLDSLGKLAQGVLTLLTMFGLLLPYGPWPIVILVAGSLPVLWVMVHYKRKQHAWQKSIASQERRMWYYDWLLTGEEGAAELRLFGTRLIYLDAYRSIRGRIKKDRLDLERHQLTGQLGAGLTGLIAAGLCMAFMVWRALQGAATFGDLVLFYQVLSQSQSILRGQLHNAGQLYGSLLFLSHLFDFLDLENAVLDEAQPEEMPLDPGGVTLRCENVSFTYPGGTYPVFSDFSLTLHKGQVTAIVGDNGAGKSTLVKLICRLYDPQEGWITWNGVDIRQLAQQDLRGRISVLFQSPMHYQATASENIAYSRSALGVVERVAITQAAEGAGADGFIQELRDGYETQLGKWFEHGTDLSVGQWQRIALARAFLRQSPLMILDEPTSAMDAWSEMEWLARLRSLSQGRTMLIITHRLTTAMQADIIHVMVRGQIVESGSHEELLAAGGRYAQAWIGEMRGQPSIETGV